MRSFWVASLLLLTLLRQLPARTYHEVTELDAVFDRYGVTGTFVLFAPSRDRMEISNRLRAQQRFARPPLFQVPAIDGSRTLSAIGQTEFLARLLAPKAGQQEESVRALRNVTLLEKTGRYELHAKAGLLSGAPRKIGWWAGWLERDGKFYPFALNIDMLKEDDAAKQILVGRECLKALGVL